MAPPPLPRPVVDAYGKGKLALLVGSGPSVASGLPKWGDLPDRLLDEVDRYDLPERSYIAEQRAIFRKTPGLEAMLSQLDTVKGALTRARKYQAALNDIFRPSGVGASEVHRAVVD